MALFDYPDRGEKSKEEKEEKEEKTENRQFTVTVGVQDRNRVMVLVVDDTWKAVSGVTLPIEDAKVLFSLLDTAIKSIETTDTE